MSRDLIKLKKKNSRHIFEPKLVEKLIKINRVSKVTKGGKKLSFRVILVIGNENGQIGIGVGKACDIANAFKKAKIDGHKNLIKFPITKLFSIPHKIEGIFGAAHVMIRPSIEGSGVIAGGAVRIVLEVAGIKNIIAKQLGSNNLLNNAFASICALKKLTTKSQVVKKRNLCL